MDINTLNAIVTTCDLKGNNEHGKLANVNVVVKDNISTKGVKTTASSLILDNYTPTFNATVVDKILNEGGRIVAKAAMDELGMGGFGVTPATGPVLNPHDTTRVAGGSSAGSAALVAAGYSDVSLGTDTGDSMRIPASYCGIVGLKPTYGRISRFGVVPYASSLDHVGIFAKDVKTAATMLEVISGFDDNDLTSSHKEVENYAALDSSLHNIKIGVIKNIIDDVKDERILEAFNLLVKQLEEKMMTIMETQFNEQVFNALGTVYKIIANAEAFSNHSNLNGVPFGVRQEGSNLDEVMRNSRTKGLGYQVRQRHLLGAYSLTGNHYDDVFTKAKQVRQLIVNDINKNLETVDFFMAPASGRIAVKIDEPFESESPLANNYMAMDNFSGHPGIVIPMCKIDGMPVGVYVSTKAFNEKQLLTLSALIEEIVGEL